MRVQNHDVFISILRHLDIEPVGGLCLFSFVSANYGIEKMVSLLPAYCSVSELVQWIVLVNTGSIVLKVENQVCGICSFIRLTASDDIVAFSR